MQQSLFSVLQTGLSDSISVPIANILTKPIQELVFTVIDIETTGLNNKKNSITELTAIQFQQDSSEPLGYREIQMFSTLVKPTDAITDEVIKISGITADMVETAPNLRDVLRQLSDMIGPEPVIVGHNVSFDICFIREKYAQAGLEMGTKQIQLSRGVCTRNLARKVLPGLPSYEGIVVATACDVVNLNPHRAEADVRMSAGILFALLKRLPHVNTLDALLTVQGPLKAQ